MLVVAVVAVVAEVYQYGEAEPADGVRPVVDATRQN